MEHLRLLSEKRRRLRQDGVRGKNISDVSKQIQRTTQRLTRQKQDDRIGEILAKFSGLKDIAAIRGRKRRKLTAARTSDGKEVNEKQEVADVFAAFYEDLYASRHKAQKEAEADELDEEDR